MSDEEVDTVSESSDNVDSESSVDLYYERLLKLDGCPPHPWFDFYEYLIMRASTDECKDERFHDHICNYVHNHLHEAIRRSDKESILYLLNTAPQLCQQLDQDGRTPLHYAIFNTKLDLSVITEIITSSKVVINQVDRRKGTPLHYIFLRKPLIEEDLMYLVERLLENGADFNVENQQKDSFLAIAMNYFEETDKFPKLIELLLKNLCKIHVEFSKSVFDILRKRSDKVRDSFSFYKSFIYFLFVCKFDTLQEMSKMIEEGIDYSAKTASGVNAVIMVSSSWESGRNLKYLLSLDGTDPTDGENELHQNALTIACLRKRYDLVKILFDDARNKSKRFTFEIAEHNPQNIAKNDYDGKKIFELLIENGYVDTSVLTTLDVSGFLLQYPKLEQFCNAENQITVGPISLWLLDKNSNSIANTIPTNILNCLIEYNYLADTAGAVSPLEIISVTCSCDTNAKNCNDNGAFLLMCGSCEIRITSAQANLFNDPTVHDCGRRMLICTRAIRPNCLYLKVLAATIPMATKYKDDWVRSSIEAFTYSTTNCDSVLFHDMYFELMNITPVGSKISTYIFAYVRHLLATFMSIETVPEKITKLQAVQDDLEIHVNKPSKLQSYAVHKLMKECSIASLNGGKTALEILETMTETRATPYKKLFTLKSMNIPCFL